MLHTKKRIFIFIQHHCFVILILWKIAKQKSGNM